MKRCVIVACSELKAELLEVSHRLMPAYGWIGRRAFRPAELIPDSFDYMQEGVHLHPDQLRPAGYPMLLRILEPFHSLLLITTLQHLAADGVTLNERNTHDVLLND